MEFKESSKTSCPESIVFELIDLKEIWNPVEITGSNHYDFPLTRFAQGTLVSMKAITQKLSLESTTSDKQKLPENIWADCEGILTSSDVIDGLWKMEKILMIT